MSPPVTARDHELAAQLATEAGRLLLDLREKVDDIDERKRMGDQSSHDFLMTRLAAEFPDDVVLSEEGDDGRDRRNAPRVWIVDPLDGTREYGELGRTDWAVHVALVIGGTPVVGAVALPALSTTLATGSTLPVPLGPNPSQRPRIIVSRTRPPALASVLAERFNGELVAMGSAGAKAMAVVRGEVEIYAHSGGQYEWDSAAPVAVALAAGFHVSRLDGSALVYNNENPWMPDLLICHPDYAADVIRICAESPST